MATRRGLEPLTSAVTGRHSNQLNYRAILTFIAVFLYELLSHEPASIVYYFKTILSTPHFMELARGIEPPTC